MQRRYRVYISPDNQSLDSHTCVSDTFMGVVDQVLDKCVEYDLLAPILNDDLANHLYSEPFYKKWVYGGATFVFSVDLRRVTFEGHYIHLRSEEWQILHECRVEWDSAFHYHKLTDRHATLELLAAAQWADGAITKRQFSLYNPDFHPRRWKLVWFNRLRRLGFIETDGDHAMLTARGHALTSIANQRVLAFDLIPPQETGE